MPTTRAASGPEPTRSPSDHSSCTPASTAAAMTAVSASPWAWTSPKTATRIALAAGVVEVLEPQLARRREEPPRRAARRADVAVDAADLVDADAAVADARVERGDREVAGARALHDGVVQLDTVDLHDVAVADLGGVGHVAGTLRAAGRGARRREGNRGFRGSRTRGRSSQFAHLQSGIRLRSRARVSAGGYGRPSYGTSQVGRGDDRADARRGRRRARPDAQPHRARAARPQLAVERDAPPRRHAGLGGARRRSRRGGRPGGGDGGHRDGGPRDPRGPRDGGPHDPRGPDPPARVLPRDGRLAGRPRGALAPGRARAGGLSRA